MSMQNTNTLLILTQNQANEFVGMSMKTTNFEMQKIFKFSLAPINKGESKLQDV